jgi:hypothetical protein
MATAVSAETFVNTQNSTRLSPESRSYTVCSLILYSNPIAQSLPFKGDSDSPGQEIHPSWEIKFHYRIQ